MSLDAVSDLRVASITHVWPALLCVALLAMSVDLMWGGAGVLSLGHGLFFALGGYIAAMRKVPW